MKRKKVSIGKMVLGVLAIYLVMAVIVTCTITKFYCSILERDLNRDRQAITEGINAYHVEGCIDTPERFETWKVGRINRNIAVCWIFMNGGNYDGDEAHLAVYDEENKKWIAKSGCAMIFREDEPLKTNKTLTKRQDKLKVEIYAALSVKRYLTDEQIGAMLKNDEYGNGTYRIEGYYNEGEIIPKQLQQYKVNRDPDTGEVVSKTLLNTYNFEVSKQDEQKPIFKGDSDHFFLRGWSENTPSSNWDFKTNNKAIIPDVEEKIAAGGIKKIHRSIFKMQLIRFEKLKTDQGVYWLSSYSEYKPLPRIIASMWKHYLAAFVVAYILLGIAILIRTIIKYRNKKMAPTS